MKFASIFALTLLAGVPALALNNLSWVSHSGNDANTCTMALPCLTFQRAYNVTNAAGTIKALDAGEYGPIVIGQSITIDGNGLGSILVPSLQTGINITAGAMVYIRNLAINADFLSCGGGCEGITNIVAGSQTTIENVAISGVNTGVFIRAGGSGIATFHGVTVTGYAGSGFGLDVEDGTIVINDSAFQNLATGVLVVNSSFAVSANIERSRLVANGTGLAVSNSAALGATARISDCLITGNTLGTTVAAGGQIITLRNNTWIGNTTDGSTPFSASPK